MIKYRIAKILDLIEDTYIVQLKILNLFWINVKKFSDKQSAIDYIKRKRRT